jgi:hypothetical protein
VNRHRRDTFGWHLEVRIAGIEFNPFGEASPDGRCFLQESIVIVNLTQHPASAEQVEMGVQDLPGDVRAVLQKTLTFDEIPNSSEILERVDVIVGLVEKVGADAAMIGGALWLVGPLADRLSQKGIKPMFAFSKRASVQETLPDGSVRKVAVFKHVGFVPAITAE